MWDLIVSVPDHCLSFYFLLFSNTLNYHNRIYFDMVYLDLTYINPNFIGYTLRQSEIKFSPLYNSMEK